MSGDLCSSPVSPHHYHYHPTNVTNLTLGGIIRFVGTRTIAAGTATLAETVLSTVHGSMDIRKILNHHETLIMSKNNCEVEIKYVKEKNCYDDKE